MFRTRRQGLIGSRAVIGVVVLLHLLVGCKTRSSGSNEQSFGWDQDVADPNTKPSDLPAGSAAKPPPPDPNFCKGLAPGTCLTLILRIPTSDLIQDLGLSTMALGASSWSMRSRLDEACQAAWQDYKAKYQGDALHALRRRLVTSVVKMRCYYQFMSTEVVLEDTKLSPNEMGFSARLTKFNLAGSTLSGDIRSVGVQIKDTFVQASFRSATLFSGKAIHTDGSGGSWQTIGGLGVAPIEFKQAIDRSISWHLDWSALQRGIEQVATNGPAVQASVAAFFSQAKGAVGQIAAAGNPAAGSLLMIGMGYNAYRSLCGENADACKVSTTKSDVTADVHQGLSDLVPSSDTNELFRLGVIRSVQGVLDQIMTRATSTQLSAMMGSN